VQSTDGDTLSTNATDLNEPKRNDPTSKLYLCYKNPEVQVVTYLFSIGFTKYRVLGFMQ